MLVYQLSIYNIYNLYPDAMTHNRVPEQCDLQFYIDDNFDHSLYIFQCICRHSKCIFIYFHIILKTPLFQTDPFLKKCTAFKYPFHNTQQSLTHVLWVGIHKDLHKFFNFRNFSPRVHIPIIFKLQKFTYKTLSARNTLVKKGVGMLSFSQKCI